MLEKEFKKKGRVYKVQTFGTLQSTNLDQSDIELIINEMKIFGLSFESGMVYYQLSVSSAAFYVPVNEKENLYIAEKIGSRVKISSVDLRFKHLFFVIFNRCLYDKKCQECNSVLNIKHRYEKIYFPLARDTQKEFKTAIIADYAYFLALSSNMIGLWNIPKAHSFMRELEKISEPIYWNYSKNFMYSYILYRELDNPGCDKKNLVESSLRHLKQAENEIPAWADQLKKMIQDLRSKIEATWLEEQ